MKAYLGDTRSRVLLDEIERKRGKVGIIVMRGRVDTWLRARGQRDIGWAFDNGAWEDHVHGKPFDEARWMRDIESLSNALATGKIKRQHCPGWAVLPDRVGGGLSSLEFSLRWRDKIGGNLACLTLGWYLAVQDGMTPADITDDVLNYGPEDRRDLRRWLDRLEASDHGHVVRVGVVEGSSFARRARRFAQARRECASLRRRLGRFGASTVQLGSLAELLRRTRVASAAAFCQGFVGLDSSRYHALRLPYVFIRRNLLRCK